MEFIVKHPNYSGMPDLYKSDGSIRWVVTGNSKIGERRREWWKEKAEELGIPIEGKWISKAAKKNHPTGKKVCQICGRTMKVEYAYPTKNLIKKLNSIQGFEGEFEYEDFRHIRDILHEVILTLGEKGFRELSRVFKIPQSIEKTEDEYWRYIYENYVKKESSIFSPGAMSNAPDRLDGFHTYNLCCRPIHDTGRHAENLARYSEDRRAYEHWSDGDWKAASWLMQKGHGYCEICGRYGEVTPDHIGPISLGFAHLPIFQPLCKHCNSAKNNRMFLQDVRKLIGLEEQGWEVTSWHSRYIWNSLKHEVETEQDAKKLSRFMRTAHHHFMELFYLISVRGHKDFLMQFLSPKYAYFEDIRFKNIDTSTYKHEGVEKTPGTKTQYQNNAARYIRIAFESLKNYHEKRNRKVVNIYSPELDQKVEEIMVELENDNDFNPDLRELLNTAFEEEDDREKDNKLKLAILEFEKRPYKNRAAEEKVKEALEIVANELVDKW